MHRVERPISCSCDDFANLCTSGTGLESPLLPALHILSPDSSAGVFNDSLETSVCVILVIFLNSDVRRPLARRNTSNWFYRLHIIWHGRFIWCTLLTLDILPRLMLLRHSSVLDLAALYRYKHIHSHPVANWNFPQRPVSAHLSGVTV